MKRKYDFSVGDIITNRWTGERFVVLVVRPKNRLRYAWLDETGGVRWSASIGTAFYSLLD